MTDPTTPDTPLDEDTVRRFGPPTYTEEQVRAYAAALRLASPPGGSGQKKSEGEL